MTVFLQLIAETYASRQRESLLDCCFVFPNRRSGTFFRDYLLKATGNGIIMPRIATLNELVAERSNSREATRDEALFTLFNCYRSFMEDREKIDFDKFIFWGMMLLNDFDEVDMNLVDADSLFVNVERWREIRSFYLTDEQAAIIERYWGEKVRSADEVDRFWEHITNSGTRKDSHEPSNSRFLRLWEILAPLYKSFHSKMESEQIATQGMMLRQLVSNIKTEGVESVLSYERYVFIGFDMPTLGEISIFRALKAVGRADFYWDFNTPVAKDDQNTAVRLMKHLRDDFPSLYDIGEEPVTCFPEIEITGIPSETGQAKWAGLTISRWIESKAVHNPDNAVDTAVVLPDESMFIPIVHAIPEQITSMNVTMGFPLRFAPVTSLVSLITRLHIHSRVIHGEPEFFHEDVEAILSSPLVRASEPEQCDRLLKDIRSNRRYNVASAYICVNYPSLSPIFTNMSEDNSAKSAHDYLVGLLDFLEHAAGSDSNMKMEEFFIRACRSSLEELYEAVCRFDIEMHESTFIHLMERMLFNATIRFEGEPLQGLQLMGVLETRALDFDNVIITSMNERVFPKKSYVRSFIPDTLRRCYGLPTPELAEARYSYYFYRLISRARHVALIYDTRAASGRNNEMSRFMTQLLYLYPSAKVTHSSAIYTGRNDDSGLITLAKTPEMMSRLNAFTTTGKEARFFSASALKTYLNCPLQFCLRYVMNMNIDDEINDFMEASTLGQIVHEVFEKLYGSLLRPGKTARVTREHILDWIENDLLIRQQIVASTNRYYGAPDTSPTQPLRGESLVIGNAILHIVKATLRRELAFTPFDYVAGEKSMKVRWNVSPSLTVNFRQIIDRIDRVNGILRIVDYKTGDESTDLKDMEQMFTPGATSKERAIFQVLLYCELYSVHENDESPIQPYIYALRKVLKSGLSPIKSQKQVLSDYRVLDPDFKERLNRLLTEIFNPDIPFIQAVSSESCIFCNFKQFCGREKC